MTDNVYQAPGTEFDSNADGRSRHLLERGVTGQYEYDAFPVLNEAFGAVPGKKGTIWMGVILIIVVSIGVAIVTGIVAAGLGVASLYSMFVGHAIRGIGFGMLSSIVIHLIQWAVLLPIHVGFGMLCLKLLVHKRADLGEIFQYFGKLPQLALTALLKWILVSVGFICLILPGIYLVVSYRCADMLVAEKDLGPWEALESSRQAVTHYWWSVFGTAILEFLVYFVMALPFILGAIGTRAVTGIGSGIVLVLGLVVLEIAIIIWLIPFSALINAVVYHRIFGCETEAVAQQQQP